jgi:hypothetical protein
MNNRKTFWLGIVAAAALAATGCSDSDGSAGAGGSAGSGGSAGEGGAGGMPVGTANVTAVHLAPEVPSAESTAVALYVNGAEVTDLGTLSYSQSTGKIPLPAGTYDIGIGLPDGDGPLIQLDDVALSDGDDVVAVAFRTNGELPVDFFVFVNSTADLAAGDGRVFVGHGADDSALDPVDISLGEAPDCSTLIPGFVFGTTEPMDGVLDLPEGSYQLGFDLTPEDDDDCANFGPVAVPVTPGVVSILIAVDENTTDTADDPDALNPELWAIIPDAEDPQPIRTIQTQ